MKTNLCKISLTALFSLGLFLFTQYEANAQTEVTLFETNFDTPATTSWGGSSDTAETAIRVMFTDTSRFICGFGTEIKFNGEPEGTFLGWRIRNNGIASTSMPETGTLMVQGTVDSENLPSQSIDWYDIEFSNCQLFLKNRLYFIEFFNTLETFLGSAPYSQHYGEHDHDPLAGYYRYDFSEDEWQVDEGRNWSLRLTGWIASEYDIAEDNPAAICGLATVDFGLFNWFRDSLVWVFCPSASSIDVLKNSYLQFQERVPFVYVYDTVDTIENFSATSGSYDGFTVEVPFHAGNENSTISFSVLTSESFGQWSSFMTNMRDLLGLAFWFLAGMGIFTQVKNLLR